MVIRKSLSHKSWGWRFFSRDSVEWVERAHKKKKLSLVRIWSSGYKTWNLQTSQNISFLFNSVFFWIFCCFNLVAIIITRLFMMISGLPHYTRGIVLQQPYQLSHPITTSEQNFNKYSLEKIIYIKTWKAWSCHNNEAKLVKIADFEGMREEDLATMVPPPAVSHHRHHHNHHHHHRQYYITWVIGWRTDLEHRSSQGDQQQKK